MESFTCSASLKHLSNHFFSPTIFVPIILFQLLMISQVCEAVTAAPPVESRLSSSDTDFIKTSCGATLYPTICYKTLSSYANSTIRLTNSTELASAALHVTLKSAKSASRTMSELSRRNNLGHKEAGAVIDCVENIGDSVDELHKSLLAMKDLKGPEFATKMGNIETWMSAALTDEDTCMDGFDEISSFDGKIKATIRSHVVKVAQLTSNALALINRI